MLREDEIVDADNKNQISEHSKSDAYKLEIAASRRVLRRISSSYRVRNCQRFANNSSAEQTIVIGPDGRVAESRFSKLAVCGRASCPNCGHLRGAKVERQVEAIIKKAQELGGVAQLIVATSRSASRVDHEELIGAQTKAYSRFLAKLTTRERQKYGIAGVIHMPEISYTDAGINPHSNVVVIYNKKTPTSTQNSVERIFATLWIDSHAKVGLPRPTRKNGIVSQEIYNASMVSGYLTKSYKHGIPRSLFNNRWLKENGELDETDSGTISNPHDILRIINSTKSLKRFFIRLDKEEEIIRMGGLDFATSNKRTGEVTILEKIPKIVRHWLDYETITKGKNILSYTKASEEPSSDLEEFWKAAVEASEDVLSTNAGKEGYITYTVSYDPEKWYAARHGIDDIILNLNLSTLGMTFSGGDTQSVQESVARLADSMELHVLEAHQELHAA